MRPRVQLGDRLVLPLHTKGGGERIAVVVEVLGWDGSPPFAVRWEDGSETIVYPSSAAHVLPAGTDADDCPST